VRVHYPELHLCTDNGAMIAMAAAMRVQAGVAGVEAASPGARSWTFEVRPRWPLETC
jgi:N6-L-threonylcarbamoyladenine synthase